MVQQETYATGESPLLSQVDSISGNTPRHLMPVKEARHQLGGISHSTFYALVKEGELSLVKIGRRSFVLAEGLDEFLRRKRYDPSGRTEAALASSRPTSWQPVTPRGRQD